MHFCVQVYGCVNDRHFCLAENAAFSADLKGAYRMFQEKSLTIRMPLVGWGDQKVDRWLALLAAFRAWLFLAILLVVFALWAECVYHRTFLFTAFNIQSIAVFTVTPLFLGLGETFVVISGGIYLSVGFTMGLSAVVMAHIVNASASFGPVGSLVLEILAGIAV